METVPGSADETKNLQLDHESWRKTYYQFDAKEK